MIARRLACVVLGALLLLGLAGCFNPFAPAIAPANGVYVPPPSPSSPQGVIRLFEWCYNNRDITLYRELFTADYQFVFASGDSAGNQYRDDPVDREMELNMAEHLFVGGGSQAPAASISLVLDATLYPMDDSRPGKNPKWHREIATNVKLEITTEDEAEYRVTGTATFFVVRGDSANIPSELGLRPDSTRWYIDRWEDYTLGSTAVAPGPIATMSLPAVTRGVDGGRTAPASASGAAEYDVTWGRLKSIYAR